MLLAEMAMWPMPRLNVSFERARDSAENRLHQTIPNRFGSPMRPREWFLVPLRLIDEAVQLIRDGSITDAIYDPKTASLVSRPLAKS